jgi:hypothetical protein
MSTFGALGDACVTVVLAFEAAGVTGSSSLQLVKVKERTERIAIRKIEAMVLVK